MDKEKVLSLARETASKLHGVPNAVMTPEAEAWAIYFAEAVAAAKKEECANKVKALIDVALETADGDPLGEYISKAIRAL